MRIIGIDPASPANAPFRDGLVSGEFLTADDRERHADRPDPGRQAGPEGWATRINLLVNTSNGDVDEQTFTIRGIYTTNTPGYDESTVFLPLAKAQAITQAENHASTIFILLKDQRPDRRRGRRPAEPASTRCMTYRADEPAPDRSSSSMPTPT